MLRPDTLPTPDEYAPGVVAPGRTVEVEYLRTGRVASYLVTEAASAGAEDGPVVTAGSPVGEALLGRPAGTVAAAELPDGRIERLRVVAVHD